MMWIAAVVFSAIFTAAKLWDKVDWDWIWVLSPLWIVLGLYLLIIVVGALLGLLD